MGGGETFCLGRGAGHLVASREGVESFHRAVGCWRGDWGYGDALVVGVMVAWVRGWVLVAGGVVKDRQRKG